MIDEYGGQCVFCGERSPFLLTIDHVNGDGAEHRKTLAGRNVCKDLEKRGWPKDNFRLACMNCNWSLGKWGFNEYEAARLLTDNGTGDEATASVGVDEGG
jgi:hypothetical protein